MYGQQFFHLQTTPNKQLKLRKIKGSSPMKTVILGIESSCDDTGSSILIDGKIVTNITNTQTIHEKYGGVVPEAASRQHTVNIIPVVNEALAVAGVDVNDLSAIAFTQGPGLIGSLMVGASFAKGLALALDIPLIAVNHMQAHVLAHFIDEPKPQFPFLCLTVSGGHTQIVYVKAPLEMEVIGQTLDDAAGEAFDKTAKLIGLPYPGGPLMDKLAKEGNPDAFELPEPKIPRLNFSFSGLKTAVLYFIQDRMEEDPEFIENNRADLAASIQKQIVRILLGKLRRAVRETRVQDVAIAGGVSANSLLRKQVAYYGEKDGFNTFIPAFEYCTDNAAMIAMTGYFKYLEKNFADQSVVPVARFPL